MKVTDESKPTWCPWCGSTNIDHAEEWSAKTEDGEYAALDEYQCHYCGASFWA